MHFKCIAFNSTQYYDKYGDSRSSVWSECRCLGFRVPITAFPSVAARANLGRISISSKDIRPLRCEQDGRLKEFSRDLCAVTIAKSLMTTSSSYNKREYCRHHLSSNADPERGTSAMCTTHETQLRFFVAGTNESKDERILKIVLQYFPHVTLIKNSTKVILLGNFIALKHANMKACPSITPLYD